MTNWQGIEKYGSTIAFGFARCSFGDELLKAVQNLKGEKALDDFLVQCQWPIELQHELESNSRGMLR